MPQQTGASDPKKRLHNITGALLAADICELVKSVAFEGGRTKRGGAGVPALLMETIEKNRKALKLVELEKMER
jgi:hypothetical protein